MSCYGFKCGTGTASRAIDARMGGYRVGALVQANHGSRALLRVAGVPVGQELPQSASASSLDPARAGDAIGELGSIIIVVATDAPLLPHQLKRVARRAALGLGRTGSVSSNGSGDIFLAFSTANPGAAAAPDSARVELLSNARIGAVFQATVEATEEAIVNALVAAETMTGVDGHRTEAISHEALRQALRKYNRLAGR
jgi:L-aminopeptidase/D-esterase-like protein